MVPLHRHHLHPAILSGLSASTLPVDEFPLGSLYCSLYECINYIVLDSFCIVFVWAKDKTGLLLFLCLFIL